jgi:hypothetical protein
MSALPSAHTPVLKAEHRIALFRNLFRGRDDVYAVRWENTDGRSGHMPIWSESEEDDEDDGVQPDLNAVQKAARHPWEANS